MPSRVASKLCVTCGRRIDWRAKWRNTWDEVRYCSKACRAGTGPSDQALEQAILRLGQQAAAGKTFCPSQAAYEVFGEQSGWPSNGMQRVRSAARRLVARGELEILQGGRIVDPSTAKGPIRLRLTAAARRPR